MLYVSKFSIKSSKVNKLPQFYWTLHHFTLNVSLNFHIRSPYEIGLNQIAFSHFTKVLKNIFTYKITCVQGVLKI